MIDIYYGLFEIYVQLRFIYILLISYLWLYLRVLVVSPLHYIMLAMWFGVTPRESSLARWLGSYLSMTSLSDRNMSRECTVPTKENKAVFVTACCFYCLIYALRLMQSSVALSSWLCRGSQLNTKRCMLDSPLRGGWLVRRCWWINDLLYNHPPQSGLSSMHPLLLCCEPRQSHELKAMDDFI